MLLRALGELPLDEGTGVRTALDIAGKPIVALLAGVLLAMFTLGIPAGFDREQISGIARRLAARDRRDPAHRRRRRRLQADAVDAGRRRHDRRAAEDSNLYALILGWLVAVGIRLATGSATVATITAAASSRPWPTGPGGNSVALLALAIGAGSLFFSHVNDAGFWLVKEYFGMTVGQTIKTWSVMETIISVVGLLGVLLLSVVV